MQIIMNNAMQYNIWKHVILLGKMDIWKSEFNLLVLKNNFNSFVIILNMGNCELCAERLFQRNSTVCYPENLFIGFFVCYKRAHPLALHISIKKNNS
jgi:hypothetical protein